MNDQRVNSTYEEILKASSVIIDKLAKELYILLNKAKNENPPIADNSDNYIVHEYFFIQCDRFISILDSLALLFPPLCQDLNREYAIGILLRSALLDVGILQYLWVSTTDKSDLERVSHASQIIRSINTEQLKYYLLHRERLKRKGDITDKMHSNELDDLYQHFPYAFKSAPKKDAEAKNILVKVSKPIGAKTIIDELSGKELSGFFSLTPITLYEHYCKYEHYGLVGAHLRITHTNHLVQSVLDSTYFIAESLRRAMITLLKVKYLPEPQETKCQELLTLLEKGRKATN